jgi:hypothetical protein
MDWLTDGLALLRKHDPEMARQVHDGEMTLNEARAELLDRERAEEAAREAVLLRIASVTQAAMVATMGFQY